MTFFNQLAQSFVSRTLVECPRPGYTLKKIPGPPDSSASFTPAFLSSSLESFPSDSGTNGSSSPCPQKIGIVVAGDSRSYHRHVKLFSHQNEAHAYLYDLFLDC